MEESTGESPAAHRPTSLVNKRPCLNVEGEASAQLFSHPHMCSLYVSATQRHACTTAQALTPGIVDQKSHFIAYYSLGKNFLIVVDLGFWFFWFWVFFNSPLDWLGWPQTYYVYNKDDFKLLILLSPPLPCAGSVDLNISTFFYVVSYMPGKHCTG